MTNTAQNSGETPPVGMALPAPSGMALPPPGAALSVPMAPPPPPPAPPASELEHPSIIARLAPESDDADDALVALASLPAEALAPPTFHDPIGLPEATRLSVLALFQDRAQVWNRLDALEPHEIEFQRAVQRTFGPGVAPELPPLTSDGDPEAEVEALRDAVTTDSERIRELTALISSHKIEVQRLRNTSSHLWLWILLTLVLVGGGIGAYEFFF